MLGGIAGLSLDNTEDQGVHLLHPEECEEASKCALARLVLNADVAVGQVDRAWAVWQSEALSGVRF